jgi:hypothetical protein
MKKSYKNCISDNQCDKNYMCTFDTKNLKHYCKSSNQNKLYLGCLDNDFKDFDHISSHSSNTLDNFQDCLDFSRKQTNKEAFNHNYLMFNKKKSSPVDLSSINIYLLCGNKNIATFPIEDYFESSCDENNEICKFKAKEIFFNFIKVNKTNCNEKLFLEINYECYNENLKNKEIIPIDEIKNKFSFKLECPKNKKDPKFQAKCISFYIDENDKNKYSKINQKKLLYGCKNPMYKTPMLVNNMNKYKKNKFKHINNQINEVDTNIELKREELLDLEAQKFQQIHQVNNNENISKEKAIQELKKKNIQNNNKRDKSDIERKWKLFKNHDALQNIIDDVQYKSAISYYGKAYTIEEAMKLANENNQSFFVYYSNSYQLDNYASCLYFIDIYEIDNQIFDMKNWEKSEGVTSALLNFENYYDNAPDSEDDINVFKDYISNLLVYQQLMGDELKHLNNKNVNDVNNINEIVITNLNKNLEKKITTKNQAILLNNKEESVNNYLINILVSMFILSIIIFVFILLYFNSNKKNNIINNI